MMNKKIKIRVLTICREVPQNLILHKFPVSEFIFEQNIALTKLGVDFDYFLIKKGGYTGYLSEMKKFHKYLKKKKYYDLIHAHGGHIGAVANTQRNIPVVTTYHGSDINDPKYRLLSSVAVLLSRENIFVSSKMLNKFPKIIKGSVIPCGIDFDIFKPMNKVKCRKELGLNENSRIALFAGKISAKVKNFSLAQKAAQLAKIETLIELNGYNREEVAKLINACDLVLLTSKTEGSPMIIKEAMACNCPVVATDVGDIKDVTSGVQGCFICTFKVEDVAEKINLALKFNSRTNGREMISHFDKALVAKKIYNIYNSVLKN